MAAVTAEGDWLVSVMTLEAEPGGLSSQATLTVFAADGKSMSTPLGHPGIGLFRSGACDQFTVSLIVIVTSPILKLVCHTRAHVFIKVSKKQQVMA